MPDANLPDVQLSRQDGLVVREVTGVPRHRSAGDAKEITDFLDLVNDALLDYQIRLGIATTKRVGVQYITPKEYLESPDQGHDVVLFKLISRERWNTTTDGERRPWKPIRVASADDPNDPNNYITIYSEVRENIVEFAVYSKHSKRANELATFFERFMTAYTWYFKDMGIKNLYFETRTEDSTEVLGNDEFAIRPLRYMVFTDLITQEVDRKIQVINIQYDVGNRLKVEEVSTIPWILEYSIDHGA